MTGIETELTKTKSGMVNWAQLNKDLTEHPLRNKYIVDLIIQNPEQKIIVLTWTKDHVSLLYNMLIEKNIQTDFLCGSKQKYNDSQVLIGTIPKIGTGFDEATSCHDFKGRKSNMLILCGSTKNTGGLEQFVGRVFRADFPTVFHLVDNNKIVQSHWKNCEKWYISRNGDIHEISIDIDNVHNRNERKRISDDQNNDNIEQRISNIKEKLGITSTHPIKKLKPSPKKSPLIKLSPKKLSPKNHKPNKSSTKNHKPNESTKNHKPNESTKNHKPNEPIKLSIKNHKPNEPIKLKEPMKLCGNKPNMIQNNVNMMNKEKFKIVKMNKIPGRPPIKMEYLVKMN